MIQPLNQSESPSPCVFVQLHNDKSDCQMFKTPDLSQNGPKTGIFTPTLPTKQHSCVTFTLRVSSHNCRTKSDMSKFDSLFLSYLMRSHLKFGVQSDLWGHLACIRIECALLEKFDRIWTSMRMATTYKIRL